MPSLDNISYQDDIINYAFISKDKNEGPIDITLKANDTKKEIEKNFKIDKIINLETGEELSKIIISNLLKNSKDMKEEEEIKLSKEYQVLSKNTSLFGEILKDGLNSDGELIKVELNTKQNQQFDFLNSKNNIFNMRCNGLIMQKSLPMERLACVPKSKPMERLACVPKSKNFNLKKSKNLNLNMLNNRNLNMPNNRNLNMSKNLNSVNYNCVESNRVERKRKEETEGRREEKEMERNIKMINSLHEEKMDCLSLSREMFEKNKNIKKLDNFNELIIKQDIIEGFWDENEYTNEVKEKVQEEFNKIQNFVNSQNDILQKKKVIYTFIVLYYILNHMKEKIDELKLIINKAKKFLNSVKYSYDDLLQKSGI